MNLQYIEVYSEKVYNKNVTRIMLETIMFEIRSFILDIVMGI